MSRDFNMVVFRKADGSISAVQRRIFETFSEKYEVLGDIPLELKDLEVLRFLDSFSDGKTEEINALLKKLIEGAVQIGGDWERKKSFSTFNSSASVPEF